MVQNSVVLKGQNCFMIFSTTRGQGFMHSKALLLFSDFQRDQPISTGTMNCFTGTVMAMTLGESKILMRVPVQTYARLILNVLDLYWMRDQTRQTSLSVIQNMNAYDFRNLKMYTHMYGEVSDPLSPNKIIASPNIVTL